MKPVLKLISISVALCLCLTLGACIAIPPPMQYSISATTIPIETQSAPTQSSAIATAPSATTAPTAEPTSPTGSEPPVPPIEFPLFYSDDTATISISKEWFEDAWCYIAHLKFSDYIRLGTACANGGYGNGYETTSHASARLQAIFAVNGCYSAPHLNYPVVRSGTLCNGADRRLCVPAVYSSNTGLLQSAWETGGTPGIKGVLLKDLVAAGTVTDTFSFGPPILAEGAITVASGGSRAQRTFIGTTGAPGDLWVIVSEGRYADGKSAGLTGYQCGKLLSELGCEFGVPLDGGGSSTMVFLGQVLNSACGNERAVVDFLYFK